MTSEDVPNMWKRGPFYYLGTRDANGKLHWKSSKCRTKAEAMALIANGGIKQDSPETTISQFLTLISERLKGVLSPGTIRNYKDSLTAFQAIVGDKPLNEITSDSVETFKQKRRSQVEPGTVNRDLRNLKSLFSRAQRNYKPPKIQGVYHITATSRGRPQTKGVARITVLTYYDPRPPAFRS